MKRFFFLIINILVLSFGYSQSISYPDSSVLSSGKWYSVSISTDGVYKLTYNDFISLGVSAQDIDFDNLSIYGNTGKAIDEVNAKYTFSDLKENAIYVNKEAKYVLFYAEATTQRNYDDADSTFSFTLHPYADKTTYFITFEPNIGQKKRIQDKTDNLTSFDTTLTTSRDFVFHKRELTNVMEEGKLWVGENFSSTLTDVSIPISLTNINNSYPCKMLMYVLSKSSSNTSYDVSINNSSLGNIPLAANSQDQIARMAEFYKSFYLNDASNTINLHFNPNVSASQGWLNYILFNYTKSLNFNNNYLRFFSTDLWQENKTIKYVVSNVLSSSYQVWDVTNPTNVEKINNTTYNDNTLSFLIPTDTLRTIVVLSGTSFATPTLNDSVINQNLHALSPADLVIITYKDFKEQANRLAEIHKKYDSINVNVVDIDQIYNEFSSGTKDFLAIREFIRMLYNKYKSTNQQPRNVLLFGDGTYDNKNILKYNNNYIPTYQANSTLVNGGDTYTSDDVLACLSPYAQNRTNDTLLVGIGRLPINDTNQAKNIVDKCERYITRADLRDKESGEWRNSVMLSSDDADNLGELYFINNAENIYYQIDETNPVINVQKVYSDAYKEYTSSSGATYPDASKAINDRMKKGCLLFNYLGHGSPDHLSGERLVTITDITSWTNYNKLALMITSTCEFARFDMVDKPAAGEYVLYSTNGAGIALIAASRKISSNDGINKNLHRFALERQANGKAYTFGEVMKNAKNNTSLMTSERSIVLLGDPALRMSLPTYDIKTTQINNSYLNSDDSTFSSIDTVHALSTMNVKGEIRDFQGNKINDFNGKIQITLFDKKSNYYTLDNEGLDSVLEFEQQNNVLHKGYAEVINGEFSHTFIIPKDIAYNYGKGKLSYYAQNDSMDAAGYSKDFIIGGIDTSVSLVEDRPNLNLYLNDSNFVSGGISNESPNIYAVVYDTIPINTVGTGLGHDIVARLDNAANTFILNDYYTYDENDINKGYITYPLSGLEEGEHTLSLKVWNIFNFSTEQTITFTVSNSSSSTYQALNYPNPFSSSTNIILRYNQPKNIKTARVRIFNQQGRMIKDIDATSYINTYTIGPITWDGTIDGGKKLSSGIYFFSIVMKTDNGDEIIKGQKMIILPNK
jgi:hypothetical protein